MVGACLRHEWTGTAGAYSGHRRPRVGRHCVLPRAAPRPRPTPSNGRWSRPIRTIRRSTRSAPLCARPTRTCRRRCRAIGRSSASPPPAATIIPSTLSQQRQSAVFPNSVELYESRRRFRLARHRRDRDADAVQRLPDRQQDASGRKPGDGRARDVARHRAAGAARCRHRLHEFAARSGDPRSQPPQRRSAHRTAQADARPLQCRRGDAHRRRASRIAAWRPAARHCSARSRITSPRKPTIAA